MRRATRSRDLLYPERILSNLIKDYQEGRLDNNRFLYRAVVKQIDMVGGKLEKTSPKNPRNSIKARIITNNYNAFLSDEDLPVFWPLFSHDKTPVKEGEHVYIIFEDERKQRGLWLTRAPEPLETDSKNYSAGVDKYKLSDPAITDRMVQGLDKDPSTPVLSSDTVVESVPSFSARSSDRVLEGSNNTTITIGRDRPAGIDSGQRDNAGTIDLVAGRVKENDMDMVNDKSRVYISMKTDPDDNFGITDGKNASEAASVVITSDEIRIVARKDMKLVVD